MQTEVPHLDCCWCPETDIAEPYTLTLPDGTRVHFGMCHKCLRSVTIDYAIQRGLRAPAEPERPNGLLTRDDCTCHPQDTVTPVQRGNSRPV